MKLRILLGAAYLACLLGGALWVVWFTARRSKDPRGVRFKWMITFGLLGGLLIPAAITGPSLGGAFIVPITAVAIAVILSYLWTPHIASVLASPITSAIDGGSAEVEAQPYYSIAQARRKAGKFREAAEEVQRQLEKFPHDHQGQMLLASIYAEDLNDVSRAELIVLRHCNGASIPAYQVASALNALCDWQLKHAQDRELAQQALECLIERLPDTEFARTALQKIAHLANTSMLLAAHERPPLQLKPGVKNIGLLSNTHELRPAEAAPSEQATGLLRHLTQFPDDNDAREQLAEVYACGYQRPEMAIHQLEHLIALPHQPAKQVVHWLNRIADLQVKQQLDFEAAAATLRRIMEMFPNAAAAENARSRLNLLRLEQRSRHSTEVLTLPEYEQRLGLKWSQRRDDEGREV